MNIETKRARLPSGIELPYVEAGDPSGWPVILLHGVTDSWRSYELVLPHLPGELRVFAITQRGHGDASKPQSGYRVADFAEDVAGFVRTLGLRPAIVVGHSMGSAVAMHFAARYPQHTRGLVPVAAFCSIQDHPGVRELYATAIADLDDPVDEGLAREFQESTIARLLPPGFLETAVSESRKVPAFVWRAVFKAFLAGDFAPDLAAIAAPTQLFWGDQDAFCSRGDQEALLAAIPGSRLAVYAGTGHAVHWEEPKRFAGDLARFCRETA